MRFSLHGSIVFHNLLHAKVLKVLFFFFFFGSDQCQLNGVMGQQFNVDYSKTMAVQQTVVGVELEGVGHSLYGGGLYSQMIFDESFEDPNDHGISSAHFWSPETFPSFSFRHCSGQLFATPFGVAGTANNIKGDQVGSHPEDHHFTPVPALNGKAGYVSFQSENWPTSYIAPITGLEPGRLGMLFTPPQDRHDDVSFQIVKGLGNPAMSSIKSMDGRYFTMIKSLTGTCVQYFAPPMGDVVLMSLADIQSNNLTHSATWQQNSDVTANVIHPEFAPAISLRHCNSQLFATNYAVGGPKADHHFNIVPGLNGKSGYASFQSENYETGYIGPVAGMGIESGRLGLIMNPPNHDAVSFQIVAGVGNKAMSSIKSLDGRFFTIVQNLTGVCAPYYAAPAGDAVLMSLSDLQSKGLTHRATFQLEKLLSGQAHWTFQNQEANVKCTTGNAFNGKCNAVLVSQSSDRTRIPKAEMPRIINSGLYHRGLNITKNSFQGYVFLKKLSGQNPKVTVGLLDGRAGGQVLASQAFTVTSPAWAMFNFTLASTGDAKGAGSFFIELNTASSSVGVDMVFLEPGNWGLYKGLHLRKDVANMLLLGGEGYLQSIRLDGSSILNPDWKWASQRGPAWNRPAIYGDYWYHAMSGGFGIFEVLQLAEKANLAWAAIGIMPYYETPTSVGDLMEYLYGDASTAMGRLRAADGHPAPYLDRVVIELGNEDNNPAYVDTVMPLITAMRARLAKVAPAQLKTVRFGVALYSTNWPGGDQTIRAKMVESTKDYNEQMIWDLHTGGSTLYDAAGAIGMIQGMVTFVEDQGWTQKVPLFIGETNCAVDRGTCSGLARALLSSLYYQLIVRDGRIATLMPAVWGYSTCDSSGTICGATDGSNDWPQEALIITQGYVIPQPSWYARAMVARAWGNVSHTVTPDQSTCTGGIISILALGPSSSSSLLNFQIVSTCTEAVTVSISVTGRKYCDSTFNFEVLGGVDLKTFNDFSHPSNLVPVQKSATVDPTGHAVFALPRLSLATASVGMC